MTSKNNNPDLRRFDPFASVGESDGAHRSNPRPTPSASPIPTTTSLTAPQIQALQQQGFSSGLIHAFSTLRHGFPLRIWILDNSEAMNVRDSHQISGSSFHDIQNITGISRWQELNDCVVYHAQMAAQYQLKTRFALLNDPHVGPQYFSIGEKGPTGLPREMQVAQHVMTQTRPSGPTPLTPQLTGLQKYIRQIAPQLRQQNQTVTVVLATQGLPTCDDGSSGRTAAQQFTQTLQSLEGLPVWVIVRLCTDDETVFDFYNSLDSQLNLPFDVLDDFFGESLEVYLRNPWLTYGLSLHRFREMGIHVPVLDVLDERALTIAEVRDLCALLFVSPQKPLSLPDPTLHWNAFLQAVSTLMARESPQWNPVTRTTTPWINLHDLNRLYGGGGRPQEASPRMHPYPNMPPGGYPMNVPQQQHHVPDMHHQPNAPSAPPSMRPNVASQHPRQSIPSKTVPPPFSNASQPHAPQKPTSTGGSAPKDATMTLKRGILTKWALQPPQYQTPRPIEYLLGTIHTTFPPANGVEPHDYFHKWKPFSSDALSAGQAAVIKRAVRKCKFFLHPDKLPRDFTEKQTFLCRTLWDVIADAMEATEKSNS